MANNIITTSENENFSFLVKGQITDLQTGNGLSGLMVEAFDKDLRKETSLGACQTDDNGQYQITYTRDQFIQAEKSRADLFIRLYDQDNRFLGESELEFNAPPEAVINLAVSVEVRPGLSEYERYLAEILPLLEGQEVGLQGLEERDFVFLNKETGIELGHIQLLSQAERLSREVDIPAEVFYGFGRRGLPMDIQRLSGFGLGELRAALEAAMEENIIPDRDKGWLKQVLDRLVRVKTDHTSISEVVKSLRLDTSPSFLNFLSPKNIHSLLDIRKAGGIAHFEDLPLSADDPLVEGIEAQAQLSVLPSDLSINARLIQAGYKSLEDIARSDRKEFIEKNGGAIGEYNAARIYSTAKVQVPMIRDAAADLMANFASSLPLIPAGVDKPVKPLPDHLKKVLFPSRPCKCQQCESAVSPLAYLADLLIYTKDRLRNGNTSVDYRFLEGYLHQKFGTLPKSYKSVEAKVRQVRIAVEVLRKFYNSTGTPDEREALAKIYHTLLIQTGTTYTELRAVQYATKEEKEALAERLGLSAPTPLLDPLKELLLDTQTSTLPNLEGQLESLFGFASTLKDPLQDRPEPKLLTWRRARLRQLWMEQDWPEDLPANNDPIIDPDIIGPDDFRHPDPSKVAFSLWKKRREWVDNELAYLKTITRTVTYSGPNEIVPDIEQMVDAMYAGRPYPSGNAPAATASWPVVMTKKDLWLHYNNLSQGQLDKDQTKELLRKLDSALGLNADAFRKLMLTWEKDMNWHSDPRNPKAEIQEWDEVYSILCQSLKKLLFPHWHVEEEGAQIAFGPNEFWFSISEPTEGHWPPQYDANFPMIDPEILTPRDLPDPTAGEKARLLFEKRKEELTVFGARLENLRTDPSSGFLAMLEETFGHPLPLDLDQTETDLNSSDTAISETAKTAIRSQLYLSKDQFLRLMAIRAKENQPLVAGKPSATEYKELNTLLTAAYKRRVKYPVWKSEENSDGLVYWRAFKSKLPVWRAAAEARTVWQQALRLRMRAPIIDPDLISSSHLHRPWTQDDKAGTLWRDRTQAIKQKWNDLKSKRETAGPIPGFENIISESLGITIVELRKIDEERKKGIDTTRRLAQLNLSTGAHNFLVQMDQLLTGNQTVDVQEWETVYSILTQVWKDRNVAAWLEAEKKDGISLSPDHFKLPGNNTLPELPPWRANFERRLEWEEKLQSRMHQEKALKEAAWQSVSAAEEIALPALRDALIKGAPVQGDTLEEKAKQLSDRLLIEMRDSGCAKTTRVSQSIETLQNLLFSVRTGQLQDTYPTLSFSPGAMESFDNDWQWMGSYSAWRAAMFVFLYPENILLPSLRKKQTPGFRGMVTYLRNVGKVTPERARQAAKIYSDYFRDVCSLKLEATTTADVNIDTNGNKRKLLFLFARSEASNKVYWCTRDGLSKDAATQTYWDEVKPLSNVLNLIGSVEYQISNTERFIYLFAKAHDGRNNKLVFVRYDLERNYWLEELNELELPDKATNFDNAKLLKRAEQDELALSSPPKILITLSSGSSFTGQLNLNGKDWGDTPLSTSFSVSFAAFEDASRSDPQFALKSRFSNEFTAKEITRWFNAAHRFAENKGFAAGFPTFHQDGDKFGVIKLKAEAVIVTSVPANILNSAVVSDSYTAKDLAGRFAAVNQYVKTYRPDCITGFPNFIDNGMNFGITLIKKFNSEKSVGGTAYIHPINLNSKSRWENDFNADLFAKRITACNDMVMWDGDDETQKISNFKFPSFSEAHKDHPDEICYIHAHRTYTTEYKPQIIKAEELSMIKPVYSGSFIVSSKRDKNDNERFQYLIRNAYENDNKGTPISILGYFDEAWYFAPMHIALQLHRYGYFTEALDWFSTVYDYSAPADKRKIYYGLVREDRINNDYSRLESWLGDPLDPHLIAGKRRNVYKRYTLMSIIRCFLDYADAEFSRDTSESVPLARTLYQTALELLETEDLKQSLGGCEEIIAELKFRYGDEFVEKYPFSRYGDFSILKDLAQQINVVMNKDLSQSEKMRQVETTIQATYIENVSPPIELHEVIEGSEKTARKIALSMMALPEVEQEMQVARSVAINSLEFWGPEEMENHALGSIVPALIFTTCVPPNPLLQALRLRAANNLRKIRTCRNIAGVKRELEPYAAPTDTSTGMPVIGFGGQLIIPGVANYRPSPYRYAVLIERAKQLVQIAQQVESAMLSALQQRDVEAYNILKARQDVQTAHSTIRLHDLRKIEAESGVQLTELQRNRAVLQTTHFQNLIEENLNSLEIAALASLWATSAANLAIAGFAFAAEQYSQGASAILNAGTAAGSALSTQANYDRRKQDWEFQRLLAQQDFQISNQQIAIAEDHVQIVEQELAIAELQTQHAEQGVDFLNNKFTNTELYEWMSGILEGVYRLFLQQATTMAQMAASQLAFERQETPPSFIQSDYWEPPAENNPGNLSNGQVPDRRGLTGSARLLQDIYQLDQYAFDSNKRKLQLSKTFSLAQLAPVEFQRFRETGVLTFATPMELFDRDFPGHFLRLVWRTRISVIALIPPGQGIKAILTANRISRVVIGGDVFQTVRVQHGPESVAITSPQNATGLFDMDIQSDMLTPFENIGVDTTWELRMPKAANPFDFNSIADVLFTIEYTALNSLDYKEVVIQKMRPNLTADRGFSIRQDFPDAWYDFNNPELLEGQNQMKVVLETRRGDFPMNLENIRIQQVVLYFVRQGNTTFEVAETTLLFAEQGNVSPVGGSASSIDCIISTRRGNASSWMSMIGKSPCGKWTLSLPNTIEMNDRFKQGEIEDILLVITYSGRTPEWPA